MNTQELTKLLRTKYQAPAWAFFTEVANCTGLERSRYADAIAMSLYPSRGLDLHGHECKVSRADWLRELFDPAKSETIAQYCDFWWIVAGDKSIVADGELPSNWGLMVPRGKKLFVSVKATRLAPKPVPRSFLAALLRRANEQSVSAELLRKTRSLSYDDGIQSGKSRHQATTRELESVRALVVEFEKASGVKISEWTGPCVVGQAFKAALESDRLLRRLQEFYDSAHEISAEAHRILDDSGLVKVKAKETCHD